MFARLNWGNRRINITPPNTPLTLPLSCVGSGLRTQAATQAPSSGSHTASLSRPAAAQPSRSADQRRKISPAPQTQLCAFTDSHCVAHSNTCTYFSMVSLASTTRSLSVHMSCVLLKSESGNQRAQETAQHVNTERR